MPLPWEFGLVNGPVIRGANAFTECCVKSGAKHEISSSKSRVNAQGSTKVKMLGTQETTWSVRKHIVPDREWDRWKMVRRSESYFHNYLMQCLWIEYIKLVFLRFLVRLRNWAETLRTNSEKGLYLDNTAV